jgi:hypothetical protein
MTQYLSNKHYGGIWTLAPDNHRRRPSGIRALCYEARTAQFVALSRRMAPYLKGIAP